MPQISVIVPVYKVEKYINRCVDSILAQTFTDFELILVDDGSPDNCGAICDDYAAKDSRIYVIHQKNGGLSAARNAGIDWAFANSDSEWLSFIDSDDWVHPRFLEVLHNAVIDTGLSIAICGKTITDGAIEEADDLERTVERINPEDMYINHGFEFVVAWNKLYKQSLFAGIRFPNGKIHEDEFTSYKILYPLKEIAFINQPLYAYFYNENSIVHQKWNKKRLQQFDAYEEQIQYCVKNGYDRACERIKKNYLHAIIKQIDEVAPYENDLLGVKKHLVSRLRKKLFEYRESFRKSCWIYEIAYPKLMRIYWIVNSVISKIRRKQRFG